MSWPPTPSSLAGQVEFKSSSLPTTLAWGTDGIMPGVIVVSCRSSLMQWEAGVENGSGLTATDVMGNDGEQMEITVVDDRSVTFPDWGAVVTLIDPRATGTSGTSTTYQVINNDYAAERKKEGQRTLLVKRFTLITPQ